MKLMLFNSYMRMVSKVMAKERKILMRKEARARQRLQRAFAKVGDRERKRADRVPVRGGRHHVRRDLLGVQDRGRGVARAVHAASRRQAGEEARVSVLWVQSSRDEVCRSRRGSDIMRDIGRASLGRCGGA